MINREQYEAIVETTNPLDLFMIMGDLFERCIVMDKDVFLHDHKGMINFFTECLEMLNEKIVNIIKDKISEYNVESCSYSERVKLIFNILYSSVSEECRDELKHSMNKVRVKSMVTVIRKMINKVSVVPSKELFIECVKTLSRQETDTVSTVKNMIIMRIIADRDPHYEIESAFIRIQLSILRKLSTKELRKNPEEMDNIVNAVTKITHNIPYDLENIKVLIDEWVCVNKNEDEQNEMLELTEKAYRGNIYDVLKSIIFNDCIILKVDKKCELSNFIAATINKVLYNHLNDKYNINSEWTYRYAIMKNKDPKIHSVLTKLFDDNGYYTLDRGDIRKCIKEVYKGDA